MEKLDRLGWADSLALFAFGVRIGVRVSKPGILDRILPLLPPSWEDAGTVEVQRLYSLVVGEDQKRIGIHRLHVLYSDSARLARSPALDQVLEVFETDLHRYTAEASPHRTFLHAGVVGWQGRAILIPGRSFSGKTTLVREMLRLGATYYSDEYAPVDNSGFIHPFPRPLGIRGESSYAQTKFTVEKLGAKVGVEPIPPGMIVITKYLAGARWQPCPLSRGQGALELLANSVSARTQPRRTLARLHELGRKAVFIRGTRGEAREAAASILNLSSKC